MQEHDVKAFTLSELAKNDGLLPMKPCWVTRDYLPGGKRLGLTEKEYDVRERGNICERWIVSETKADNTIDTPHEGQSYVKTSTGGPLLLVDALKACRAELLGAEYSKKHAGLDRLLKIFDYKTELFFHIHHMKKDADKVGMNPKEEAYYFLDADLGARPVTFFGVHPYIVREKRQEELFAPYLEQWQGDAILQHSKAYLNVPGEGFHLPPGILHAPGTALTLELQESSDIMAVMQAEIEGIKLDKKLLYRHIPAEVVAEKKEKAVLDLVDWEACGDPYFYENHRLHPISVGGPLPAGVTEEWVWYNSMRFSGTRVTLQPGKRYVSKARGVHGLFIWKGQGMVDNFPVEGQKVTLDDARDEFLVVHDKALQGVTLTNAGSVPLVAFKFFGPGINDDVVPRIRHVS
jgi:hypothetical protein